MKVLPLIFILLIVISLSVREELRSYKNEKLGRIDTYKQLLLTRERAWAEETEKPRQTPPPPPGSFEKETPKKDKPEPQKETSQKETPQKETPGTRELNIYALLDKDAYAKDPSLSSFLLQTVEKLFDRHFQNAPLYSSLLAEDPNLVPHLFEAIREKFSDLKLKMGKGGWADLSLIKLENEKLQLFFYEILKGERIPPGKLDKAFQNKEQIPLLNSLRVERIVKDKPLRLFIASPPLLEVLIEKPENLPHLLALRQSLSSRLRKNKELKPALNTEWEQALKTAGIDLPTTIATYEVSTTRI